MKSYTLPNPNAFDGKKFADRYGLTIFEFSIAGDVLTVKDESKITDDPPIFEASDPPVPQGVLEWMEGPVPGTVRLVAKFGGKTSSIVVVGQDTTNYTMFVSPGPSAVGTPVGRKEFHVATKELRLIRLFQLAAISWA
jgi:hypothetical protein